ncbi:DivIVA domain-containing protein [Corynebacterium uropygiale]|uniref:DivIVA domain-containing protein n=1 Tax=Corynebacterium uropygiale TaxID=1775911 RepID=A0A9X1QNY3_9CORY|nr:DivIVA domain-containing protein [Corynebacterium uropygiale]MCF4006897.1 DivIVA domain-containing protein [Corynebacterium uropygiale]
MLSWIAMFFALAVFGALFIWLVSLVVGRGERQAPSEDAVQRHDNAQAVAEGRIDDVRFDVVLRGYHPAQVEEVIASLQHRLDALESAHAMLTEEKRD